MPKYVRAAVAAFVLVAGLAGVSPALAAAGSAASSPWSIQAFPPLDTSTPQAQFAAVSCPSATACVGGGSYVGTDGRLGSLAERWNGASWQLLSVPASLGPLSALSCQSLTSCVALGGQRTVKGAQVSLAGTWNGTSWRVATTPRAGNFASLQSLSCTSRSFCMAVGERSGSKTGKTLAERWNGRSWRVVASPNGAAGGFFSGVSCQSARDCVAVGGRNQTVVRGGPLVAHWNGRRWSAVAVPLPRGAASIGSLSAVSCPTATACTAVGGYVPPGRDTAMLVEDLAGGHWTYSVPHAPKSVVTPSLGDVSCSAPRVCTAVVFYQDGQENELTTTAARGASGGFAVNGKQNGNTVVAVSCRPAACMVVGHTGTDSDTAVPTSYAEHGTGNNLSAVPTPDPAGTAGGQLATVSCVQSGFCATAVAGALDSDPTVEVRQGGTWSVPANSGTGALQDVSCISATFCLALGSAAGAEQWTGSGWTELAAPDHYDASSELGLAALSCISATSCVAVGSAGSAGNPHTLVVDWTQGSGWTTVSSPEPAGGKHVHLFAVSCTRAGWCAATGDYINSAGKDRALIETSADGGATWSLASADPGVPSSSTQSVSCASASACMGIWSTFGGLPTAVWWNGKSWTRTKVAGPSGRSRVTELNDVSCTSATSCTAAGDYDYYPAPAGPLVEVWNGKSWSVTPAPRPSGYGQLFGVSCTSATVCTAVGADQRAVTVPLVEVR